MLLDLTSISDRMRITIETCYFTSYDIVICVSFGYVLDFLFDESLTSVDIFVIIKPSHRLDF